MYSKLILEGIQVYILALGGCLYCYTVCTVVPSSIGIGSQNVYSIFRNAFHRECISIDALLGLTLTE